MKCLLVLSILCIGSAAVTRRNDHPVVKVIDLLKELRTKVAAEGATEAETYTKFETWCENSITELQRAIAKGKSTIERLETEIEGKEAEEELLTNYIARLADEITKSTQDGTESDDLRKEAADAYTAADADFATTVTAIGEAITELEAAKPAALVQTTLEKVAALPLVLEQLSADELAVFKVQGVPRLSKESIAAKENKTNHTAWEAPDSNQTIRDEILAKKSFDDNTEKYSFKSGGVIGLLKKLKLKFEDDQETATKDETAAINAHAVQKDSRKAAIATAEASKATKETLLGTVQGDLATAKADLKTAQDDLKADEDTMKSTKTQCDLKKSEWKERSDLRTREMEALRAGIRILGDVANVRDEQPEIVVPPPSPDPDAPAPADPNAAPSPAAAAPTLFLQVDPKTRVVNLLREEAKKTKSKMFASFANKIAERLNKPGSAEEGPFDVVNGMIQKMIWRLEQEQHDEDEHKGWCDVELSKTNISKTDKAERIKTYDAKLKADQASVDLLETEITEAHAKVEEFAEWIANATDVRQTSRKENEAAIEDAQDAQAAIAQAEAVITAFYKESGAVPKESYELLQKAGPVTLSKEPGTWDSTYTGVADPKNQPDGIITVLQGIATDFSKMEADTKAQEETDQHAFEKEMKEIKIEKARRAKEAEVKEHEGHRLKELIDATQKSRDHTNRELEAVEQYLKDLAPACIDGDSTYEDRKEQRAKEIEALQESMAILKAAQEDDGGSPAPAAPTLLQTGGLSFLAPIKRA